MNVLSPQEILKAAVMIEERGEAFYRLAAKQTKEKQAADLFTHLADEEVKHRETFAGLMSQLADRPSLESYPQEMLEYVSAFVKNVIFPNPETAARAAANDVHAAIAFALQRELDSIHFYQETRPLLLTRRENPLDAIIAEERKHFLALLDLKAKL
ncbi:MAG: ferritin family protein [candidate division FCPU426 bacterium]